MLVLIKMVMRVKPVTMNVQGINEPVFSYFDRYLVLEVIAVVQHVCNNNSFHVPGKSSNTNDGN
jgi:hypothetical protein